MLIEKKKEEDLAKVNSETEGSQIQNKEKLVDSDSDSSEEESEDDKSDFIDHAQAAVGVKKDAKTRTTVRNLRIREDTAKYLRNLNPGIIY